MDQVTKIIVSLSLPYGRPVKIINEFLRFTYVKNTAIAFSLGYGLPETAQRIIFLVLPLVVIIILFSYFLLGRDINTKQRWIIGAIIGGGISNYIDRIIRPDGVIDFIDFKFYGIIGFERWPTFNLADASVVVAGVILLISFLRDEIRRKKNEQES